MPQLLITFWFSGGCNKIGMLNIVFLYLLHLYECWWQASLLSCSSLNWFNLPQNYRAIVTNTLGQRDTYKKDVVHSPLLYALTLLSFPHLSFFFFSEGMNTLFFHLNFRSFTKVIVYNQLSLFIKVRLSVFVINFYTHKKPRIHNTQN